MPRFAQIFTPLLIAAALSSAAHADDDETDSPDPVTRRWRAHATIDETNQHKGSYNGKPITRKFEAHCSIDAEMGTTDADVTGKHWTWERATAQARATGSMTQEESYVTDGHTYVTRFSGTADPATAGISCSYDDQNWTCSAGVHYAGTEEQLVDGKVITSRKLSKAQAAMFGDGKVTVFARAKTASMTKQGERFSFHNDWSAPDAHQVTNVNIEPLDKVGYEAVFVVGSDYDQFVPEGPPIKERSKPGNSLDLHVELRDAKTHKKSAKQFSAVLTLDASRLPGTCMNFPPYGEQAPDEPDLYFDAAKNRSGKVPDEQHLELAMGKGSARVTVTSRDYGAFATLTAHVKVADGAELDALTVSGAPLAIPRDDNANHIADWWETQQGIHGGRQANTDDESLPHGMKLDGDGFTLFEEYRGFVQADPAGPLSIPDGPKPVFTRLTANKRDVFVGIDVTDPKDQAVVLDGLHGFADMNTAELHFIAGTRFLGPMTGDYNASFPRRVDLRSDTPVDLFGKPQAAIWIATGIPTQNDSPAFAMNLRNDGDMSKNAGDINADTKAYGSPSDVKMIVVQRQRALETAEKLRCYIDPACKGEPDWRAREFDKGLAGKLTSAQRRAKAQWATKHLDLLAERMMRFTIIHELGHTLGAYHHGRIARDEGKGAPFCPMRYWHTGDDWDAIIAYVDGSWDLKAAPDGSPWKWCSENVAQMRFRDYE